MKDKIPMIENVKIFAVEQTYDDGTKKVWSIGDETKDGKITEFKKNENNDWYALTDTPSEWQKERGQKYGWSWVFQLEAVS